MKALIRVENIIDLITNSSSELFVIQGTLEREVLAALINNTIGEHRRVSPKDFEIRPVKNESPYEYEWRLDEFLKDFPLETQERIRLAIEEGSSSGWYAISFDRDWVYTMTNDFNIDVRDELFKIGFELIDTDY